MRISQILLLWSVLVFGSTAIASTGQLVGEVVFVTGVAQAHSEQTPAFDLNVGTPVFVGYTLATNAIGHLHIRTIDGAFISLRSDSVVNIVQYNVDAMNPSANQIRLDVQRGAMRSVTGKAGEANRPGFRLNTPVAAIGIRGTDFTVFTDNDASSVSVRQGGVVVAPFSSVCSRQTLGACGGSQAVMLSAYDQQVVAEVNVTQASLVSKQSTTRIPDAIKPAHPAEDKNVQESREIPVSQNTAPINSAVSSEAKAGEATAQGATSDKPTNTATTANAPASTNAGLNGVERLSSSATASVASLSSVSTEIGPKESVTSELASNIIVQERAGDSSKIITDTVTNHANTDLVSSGGAVVPPPVSEPPAAVTTPEKPQVFHYGRWSSYAENAAQDIVRDQARNRQVFTANNVHLIGSTEKVAGSLPIPQDRTGLIDFQLDKGEAVVQRGDRLIAATISNPGLQIDFDTNRFNTRLDVTSAGLANGTEHLAAQGTLSETGLLRSASDASNMTVSGAIDSSATQAGYVFDKNDVGISGAATWLAQ